MIDSGSLLVALMIFFARVCDVSLGTLRHAMIIRRKRLIAVVIAFVEALIWVYAVSRVLAGISGTITALAFASGFAAGTFVGMTLEGLFKIGEQVVRVFSPQGRNLAEELRLKGYRVTVFEGSGRDGQVSLLFIQVKRRETGRVLSLARSIDPSCYVVVDDVQAIHSTGAVRK